MSNGLQAVFNQKGVHEVRPLIEDMVGLAVLTLL